MSSKKPSLFAECAACGGKLAREDDHRECMHCLYKRGHDTTRCKICRKMTSRRRHDRAMKVRARLAEESIFPSRQAAEGVTSSAVARQDAPPLERGRSADRTPRVSPSRDGDPPRGRTPLMPPPRDPPALTTTPRPTTTPSSKTLDPSTTRASSRPSSSPPSRDKRRSTSRESIRSTSSRSTSLDSTSKKKKDHSTHLSQKRYRMDEDLGFPAEESEAELAFRVPDPLAEPPEDILQDPLDDSDGEGPEGARAHLPGPGSPLHTHADALTRMQASLQSLRGLMNKRDRDWQRQQDALIARLRQEEEDRQAARELKEAQDDARRTKELEALIRSLRPEGPAPATLPKLPAPTPQVRPPDQEPDPEPDSDDESDREEPADPLDRPDPQPRGEPLDPLDVPIQEPLPNSPPDDQAQFCALLQRAAANFGIQTQKEVDHQSILMDKMSTTMRQSTQLPTDGLILRRAMEIFAKPASAAAANPRQDRKYKVPDTDPLCLRGIPPPDSIVATAARKRSSSSSLSSQAGPPEKEHRKLDTVGKKVCAAASLAIREANAIALVSRYSRDLWDTMEAYLRFIPEEYRQAAANTMAEGKVCANHGVKMALDVADTASHSMAHGVALRRHGWLQGSGFKVDIQHRLLDMPFDGQQLFGKEVEDSISKTKGELETMKGVPGLQQQQPQSQRKKDFRNQGQKRPQQKKSDKPWPSTSKGSYGNSRGNGKKGRGGSNSSRAPPKDKA